MTNKDYWRHRFERMEQREMDKADKAMADLKKVYEYALQQMRDEVITWYNRYADENGLSLADARKQLDTRELEAFKMTLKEYEKLAKQQNLSDEYIKMLDQASIRARLNRSQVLYVNMAHYVEQLSKKQEINLAELLKEVYEDSYYRTAYETQSMQGIYDTFAKVPDASIEKAISRPWAEDGKDFSERIWDNKTKLLNTLQSEITRTLIAGEGTTLLAGRIANRFNVSFSNARRLAETETAYVQETARMDTWQKLHVAKYELIATLDSRTSPVCREMDGKVFDRVDAKAGVTMPPFHCYCRTTTAPYIEGITDDDDSTRAARDPDTGKTVQVPGKMNYADWKAVYVDKSKTLEEWQKKEGSPLSKLQGLIDSVSLKTCSKDDIVSIGKAVCDHFNLKEKIGDKEYLKSVFSNFREMDGNIQSKDFAKGSALINKKMLGEAFSYYPKAWADYLRNSGRQIYTKKVRRGFFCSGAVKPSGKYYEYNFDDFRDKYVSIHMSGDRRTTPYHEIGHMVEFFNPNALRISKEFIKARTQGEKAVPLRDLFPSSGYGRQEVTKPDDFISPYIGKEYDDATEVLSMGLEQIFEPTDMLKRVGWADGHYERKYATIKEDEEYLYLIIGLILKA